MRAGGQSHSSVALPPGNKPVTPFTGDWMGPKDGLDVCGKSRPPTGIRYPDRPARSESLYRIRYRGPTSKSLTVA
jgi:hypothetical protein